MPSYQASCLFSKAYSAPLCSHALHFCSVCVIALLVLSQGPFNKPLHVLSSKSVINALFTVLYSVLFTILFSVFFFALFTVLFPEVFNVLFLYNSSPFSSPSLHYTRQHHRCRATFITKMSTLSFAARLKTKTLHPESYTLDTEP